MLTTREVIERTRGYIMENFLYARPDYIIGEREALLGRGIIDSLGVVEMLQFLHDDFGVVPRDEEITETNFGTLAGIAEFVIRKHSDQETSSATPSAA